MNKRAILLFIQIIFTVGLIFGQDQIVWNYSPQSEQCISNEQEQQIIQRLRRKHRELPALQEYSHSIRTTSFAFPVKYATSVADPGDLVISQFFDHDSSFSILPDIGVLDYNCGKRSYDFEWGSHHGTDIFAWPFSWTRMNNNEVEVVTAAEGMIIDKQDGNFDKHCAFCLGCNWNAVYVQHADGTVTWYGHLKAGSLTEKTTGSIVERGEYLGIVGSSGISSGPHLHFQVWETNKYLKTIDPFKGACNLDPSAVSWQLQIPYTQASVSYVTVGYNYPVSEKCATPHKTKSGYQFDAGDEVFYTAYFKDEIINDVAHYSVFDPQGDLYEEWDQTFTSNYIASWRSHRRVLARNIKQGEYTFEVQYGERSKQAKFYVTSPLENHPDGRAFFVFYNELKNEVVVKCSVDAVGDCALSLYNMSGQLVMNATFELILDIPHIPAGAYIVSVSDEKGHLDSQKLIVY